MKTLLLAAVLLVPAAAGAAVLETVSASADQQFELSPQDLRATLEALEGAIAPILQPPLTPQPFLPSAAPGAELGRLNLAAQLDRNLHVTNYKFGARPLDLGLATDAAFKQFFFAFTDGAGTALAPIPSISQLRGDGVNAHIDAATVYNFRLKVNIFSPVRGSTLEMRPAAGTSGSPYDLKSGALLDAVRARAVIFELNGSEYWLFYGRDALASGVFGATRSFLFVHMDGLSSKAWPLAAASLKTDSAAVVSLGDQRLSVTLASSGDLVLRAPN